ncbi:MAG: flavodoxin [Chloroflexales bacterium]|nr:flavodoxin [Chloroflexales bacterium]
MIAIVYGSSALNTQGAAEAIAAELQPYVGAAIEVIDVATIKDNLEQLQEYRVLLIGCPTWNIGELQIDWEDAFPHLDALDFSTITVALFGCGDQYGYPDNFQDAIGIIGRRVRELGATIIGRWPTDGYDFDASVGVEDGMFFGLALDEDNESELTVGRIQAWVAQLVTELPPEVLAT